MAAAMMNSRAMVEALGRNRAEGTSLVQDWPPPQVAEASLEQQPLEFICQHSVIGSSAWQPLVWDEARRCFAFHLPNALGSGVTDQFYTRIKETAPWQPLHDKAKTRISRHTAWYTRMNGCNCAYTYGEDTRVEAPESPEFRQVMDELVKCVFTKFPTLPEEAWPNCANLNLYGDGLEGVGWHADDEVIFMGTARDCPIVSLSLGGMREFWIALKAEGAPDVRKGVVEVDLKDGDLLTLEGLMQKHTMHTVPRASPSDMSRQEPRINITFRWMRLHKHQCPYAKVALTWYKMAQQQESEQDCNEDMEEDGQPAHRHDGMRILDPAAKTVRARNSKSSSKYERTLIMSPLPPSCRALFGEGPTKFHQGAPRPSSGRLFLQGWSTGNGAMGQIKWQACDACGHTCYGGGRPCQEAGDTYPDQWFCRCCWQSWQEEEKEAALYQTSYQYTDWNYATAYGAGLCTDPYFSDGISYLNNGWMGGAQ
jgi:alkylated DNA repair dioxygenase AlkB